MLTIIGGTNAAYMPSAPFMPAPAQPRRATRRRLAAAVRAAATNWDEPFEVTVQRPLGIQLAEQAGVGVVVSDVSVGSNAYGAGISVGDIVLATSATMGSGMWPKKTVDGVEAAIQTRLDGKVRLRLRREAAERPPPPWMLPIVDTFEVELSQPLGMVLREVVTPPASSGSPASSPLPMLMDGAIDDGKGEDLSDVTSASSAPGLGIEVAEVAAGGSAAAGGVVRSGDLVVATSGTLGDTLWQKSTLEGVLAAISTRLALSPTVTLRLERSHQFGPWAAELHAISCGERSRLSSSALASLRRQRRALRDGTVRGEGVHDAVRALCVPAIARTRDDALLRAMLRRLHSCGVAVDARLATCAMGSSVRARAPEVGLAYFDALTMGGGAADERAYTSLMKVHAASGRVAEALAVENRMSADRIPPSVRTYNTLMSVCARAGDRKGMLQYFQKMAQVGLRPTVESWNIVLSYCAQHAGAGRRLQAEDVLLRMRKQGIQPDVISYTCVASACVKGGEAAKCEDIIAAMAEENVQPDLVFVNTVLDGYARQLKYYQSFDFLVRMQRERGVQPDATSFAHVLRACVGARVPKQAAQAVSLMRKAGLQPDVRIYSMLLSTYGKAGRLTASLAVLKQMRKEGVKPNGHVYAGLMEACVVARQPGVAQDIFAQMTAQGLLPDAVTYTLLIRAVLTKPAEGQQPALGLADGATRLAPQLAPLNDVAPAEEAPSYAMQPRRAYDLLRRMRREGGRAAPSAVTYDAFLRGCATHEAYEIAISALGDMLEDRLTPTRKVFDAIVVLGDAHATGGAPPTPQPGGGPTEDDDARPRRPPPSKAVAAQQLAFFERVLDLFESRRLPLHADVYMPMLRAAMHARDEEAARGLLGVRREGGRESFPLRRAQRNAVLELEGEVEAWLDARAAKGVAA